MMGCRRLGKVLVLGALVIAVAGCAGMMGQKSLYERLGGLPYIQAVVDDFVANVAADTRINQRFAKTDIPRFKKSLVDQICAATGGPCTYTGLDMKAAHKDMKVTEAEWNATVEDLVKTLDKYKVAEKEKTDLLALLGPMKPDIVGQ